MIKSVQNSKLIVQPVCTPRRSRGSQLHVQCSTSQPPPNNNNPGKSLSLTFSGPGHTGSISHSSSTPPTPPKLSVTERLKSLGLAGLVSYGLFNTLYYTVAFVFIWTYVAKVPSGRGLQAAATSCAQVLALTWVGSQASKALRAGLALTFAPVIDRFLEFVRRKAGMKDKKRAFVYVLLPGCIVFALLLFGTTILAWA